MSSTTNAQKFVAALVWPLRDLETLWQQMRAMRNLDTSVGVHLEGLGKLVGRRREGIADDELYRRAIRAQVAVNESTGTIDELILIAELVVYDDAAEYIVNNTGVAALVLVVDDVALDWAVAQLLLGLLRKAVDGGVRIVVEWWPTAEALAQGMRFGSVSSGSVGAHGFGSVSDPTVGGALAAAGS